MEVSESGLPKVDGLQAILNESTQDKGNEQQAEVIADQSQQQATAPVEGQAPKEMSDEEVLAQFKSTKDLLKSYKEIQGFTTRVSQENKEKAKVIEELNGRLNKLQEEMELRSYQAPQRPVTQKTFEELFIENPEAAITMKAAELNTTQRIAEVLEQEASTRPQEFQERMGYVKMLSQNQKYAHLSTSPQGVKKLFEVADTVRKQNLQRAAQESIKVLFGDDVDMEALKSIVTKKNGNQQTNPQANNLNAYMPNTGTSTRTGADISSNDNDIEKLKQEAIKNKDPLAVAGALLRQALQK
jgi:hypothetical protein